MQIPILIEPTGSDGYRVRCGEPLAIIAEGKTKTEALQKLRALLDARLQSGAEISVLEVGSKPNPWVKYAGWLKDDPLFDDWQQAMEEYRKEIDLQEGI